MIVKLILLIESMRKTETYTAKVVWKNGQTVQKKKQVECVVMILQWVVEEGKSCVIQRYVIRTVRYT